MLRLRTIISLSLILICFCSGAEGLKAEDSAPRPNIIFIMADDLAWGDVGCYGQETIQTPNIDRMATEGMRFTQAYAGSTVCAPSRCVLMTGQNTGRCTVRGNKLIPLLPEDVTVAEVLKSAGYTTAMFGKWGLGEPETTGLPGLQGFDEWYGYLNQKNAHNYYPEFLWRNMKKETLPGNLDGLKQQYTHDLFTAEAMNFLSRSAGSANPFFLYLPYTIPHTNNELGARTGNGSEVPDYAPYKDRDWPDPEKGFAAMIARLDRDIGRLMTWLKETKLDENTIIFFTSDNGPHHEGGHDDKFFKSSGPLRGSKRDLYEGGIRVPMIVRWPGKVEAGSINDHPWMFADFLPTAAELAGANIPDGIDGKSVAGTFFGESVPEHEFIYWEFHEGGFYQAVRMGDWKAVRKGGEGQPIELFNLENDLSETSNIAADHPEIVAKIENYLATARTESEHWPVKSN